MAVNHRYQRPASTHNERICLTCHKHTNYCTCKQPPPKHASGVERLITEKLRPKSHKYIPRTKEQIAERRKEIRVCDACKKHVNYCNCKKTIKEWKQ